MRSVPCTLHHHIGGESSFEKGLNVTSSRAAYEAQIDWMAQNYTIIDLETLLSGDLPPRPLLLTFDDAFLSSFEVIRDVLAPRGLPSVFFINPGLLNDGAISLDSALAWAAQKATLAQVCQLLNVPARDSVGQVVAGDMARYSALERAGIRDRLVQAFGPPDFAPRAPLLRPGDLGKLASLGAEIGNHTASHVHCRALTGDERQSELVDSKRRLEAISGQKVRSFSVPYGHESDLTGPVLETLRASGHEAIFLVHARSNLRRPSPDIWYRISLHNEPPDELRAVLTYKPILRSLKHMMFG